jgi:predicted ATPase
VKILKFETKDHPILGDCSLDFSREKNFSNIVLIAGANGSGKTTILDELFDFLSNIYPSDLNHDLIITFALSPEEITLLKPIEGQIGPVVTIRSLRKTPTGVNWGQLQASIPTGNISPNFLQNDIFKNLVKCVYSTVEINFAKNAVSSTTAQDIDSVVVPKEKSSANISKEIAQLLVDIKALDDGDAAEWVRTNHGAVVNSANHQERISRFKKAFDYMIEGKTFQGVKNAEGRKKVYFKDAIGNEIDIADLSSGEKQIVFRAGYLLKNIGSLSGGIVLIDEPEISFHPSWQEKYIEFVKKTFSDDQGIVQAQIIIATHSPFIVQNEKITDEKILILQKSGKNTIESVWPKFYGYRQPEPVFVPIEATVKPLLLVEGKSDKQIISCAWNKLYPGTEMPFEIKWPNEPHEGGAREVQKQLAYFVQHGSQKVLGMYDADQAGLNNFNGTTCKTESFVVDPTITNLKISRKVGATYIPSCPGRELYFNENPQLAFLVLEMYLSDSDLQTLAIVEATKIIFAGQELIKIKTNHSISDSDLEALPVESFENFKVLFDHVSKCTDKLP